MKPDEYPRRILVCATGLSPQVVTETLYALAVQQQPTWVPTEIHVVTTREGAERARLMLLDARSGQFHQLRHSYKLPPIEFSDAHVHVIADGDGRAFDDINDPDANTACADTMLRLLSQFTADDSSSLHVSIAGGRKTMGYLMGYALTLFGRHQDRLSHVLVPPAYESNPEFFYPTPVPHVLSTRDNRPIDASKAQVQLANIPFLSLRSGLPDLMAKREVRFATAVAIASLVYDKPVITANAATRTLEFGEASIQLRPLAFAVWLWLARRGPEGVSRHQFDVDADCRDDFRRTIAGEPALEGPLADKIELLFYAPDGHRLSGALHDDGAKWLGERVNEINKSIHAVGGDAGIHYMGVSKSGASGSTVYQLTLPAESLRVT